MGQGSMTGMVQIVSQETGVPMNDITITPADTDSTPYDFMTSASRLTAMVFASWGANKNYHSDLANRAKALLLALCSGFKEVDL